MRIHYLHKYLMNPTHDITINLIGCGGTGSRILSGLASINVALLSLGKVGLRVTVYDNDVVTEANIGRQLYSPSDIGFFKSDVMVTRINRFYGFKWRSETIRYGWDYVNTFSVLENARANITIMAVDTLKSRKEIHSIVTKKMSYSEEFHPFYVIDTGNSRYSGQVVIYTPQVFEKKIVKRKNTTIVNYLKNPFEMFPDIKENEDDDQPSCSMPEALIKQDLFINTLIADNAMQLLWSFLNDTVMVNHGVFINLQLSITKPISL